MASNLYNKCADIKAKLDNILLKTDSIINSRLPYVELEYIESTGTQYINTGVYNSNGLITESKFLYTSIVNDYDTICGAQDATNSASRGANCLIMRRDSGRLCAYIGTNPIDNSFPISNNVEYTIKFSSVINNSYATLNGETQSFNIGGTRGVRPLYLFGLNNNGSFTHFSKARIYYLKLFDNNNNLLKDFIPVMRSSDGVICMYDLISMQFYENDGTGTFIAGPVI